MTFVSYLITSTNPEYHPNGFTLSNNRMGRVLIFYYFILVTSNNFVNPVRNQTFKSSSLDLA